VNLTALTSPAIAADGTLFLTLSEGGTYAVAPNGDLKWASERYEYGASSVSIASDGTLCFWDYCDGGDLDDLGPDGVVKWQASVLCDPYGLSCAIGQNGNFYVPVYNESLVAIGADGARRWQYCHNDGDVAAPAVGTDGTVYVAGTGGHLTAVDPQGNMIWRVTTSPGTTAPLAIGGDGTVYVSAGDTFFAVRSNGTIAWRFGASAPLGTGAAVDAGGMIYFGSSDGKLYALTPDGHLEWVYDAGGAIVSAPALGADGMVYVGAANGLHAVEGGGERTWLWPSDAIQSSPAIGPDGTVYITANFWLVAINGTAPLASSPWPMFQHDLQHTGRAQ
jgi:outer membrane protein assembly factor BamB